MVDYLLQALPLVFSFDVMLAMVVGTAAGVAIGALPGLSTTMGIAVLIPLTFTMPPLVALGLMAGIYNGAMYGGSIPAILLRIPGTPAGIATTFDGYPMAQQGHGVQAMRIALVSSALGGIVSALTLILLAPPLASVALLFGPAEVFWLAVFGLTAISVLLAENPVKGLLSAGFGLIIGTVGIDQLTGNERFTFDVLELTSGIGILVLLTGLYAIPPAFELAAKAMLVNPTELARGMASKAEDASERFAWRSLIPTWIRASGIGVAIGIVPGTGGNIASIISWNETRRAAREPERFGKGAPEGVAASECANNADNASALIPALTLGIPGNAVAAVILGGLLVHGMQPGPALFRDTAPVTYGFMLAMLITAVLLFFIGWFGARLFIYVLQMPPLLLAPMIIAMSTIGIYAINNSMFDVWLMLFIGVIGFLMERLRMPLAPAVLAVILGPMAEAELRRSLLISRGDFSFLFSSAISLILVALTIIMVIAPIVRRLAPGKPKRGKDEHPVQVDG